MVESDGIAMVLPDGTIVYNVEHSEEDCPDVGGAKQGYSANYKHCSSDPNEGKQKNGHVKIDYGDPKFALTTFKSAQLEMTNSIGKISVGTGSASLKPIDGKKIQYILTCGHNLQERDPMGNAVTPKNIYMYEKR